MKRFYMNIEQYFDEKKGVGILSTASGEGVVNSAVYARPHVLEGGQVAFIMRDKLTHGQICWKTGARTICSSSMSTVSRVSGYILKKPAKPRTGRRLPHCHEGWPKKMMVWIGSW